VHRVAGQLEFSVLSGVPFTLLRDRQSASGRLYMFEERSVNVPGKLVGCMRGAAGWFAGMECRDDCTLQFGEAGPCCHAPRHRSALSFAATEDALNVSRQSRTEGRRLSGVGGRASAVGRRASSATRAESTLAESARAGPTPGR